MCIFSGAVQCQLTYHVHIGSWQTGRFWVHGGKVACSPARRRALGWGRTGDRSSGGRPGREHRPDSRDDPCPVPRTDLATSGRKEHAPLKWLGRRNTTREISRRDRTHLRSTLLRSITATIPLYLSFSPTNQRRQPVIITYYNSLHTLSQHNRHAHNENY